MADRIRRFIAAALLLTASTLAMAGLACANSIVVNTTDQGSDAAPLCTLRDAITAANSMTKTNGCAAGSGTDTITFAATGTIALLIQLPDITRNLTITGPSASPGITISGGGLSGFFFTVSASTVALSNLTFTNGFVLDLAPIVAEGDLTISDCTFSNNQTMPFKSLGSGAIMAFKGLSVSGSTFSSNQANFSPSSPGAIFALGQVTVVNSTFAQNSELSGAAIQIGASSFLTNNTFWKNSADAGSADIFAPLGTTISLRGNIFADSAKGAHCFYVDSSSLVDLGYNISDDDSCLFTGTSVNNSTTLNLAPAGLANNGGPTQTIALEPTSEAFDFIPVTNCVDQSSPTPMPLTTDQRGFPRPDPGNPLFCDAGAFELQTMPFAFAPNSERLQIARGTTPNSDQVNTAFTFTENGIPACDAADDAFNGLTVVIEHGTCASLDNAAIVLNLDSWMVHTVNHANYGTFFGTEGPTTISARMVQLPTPAAPACGEWTINIEVSGADTEPFGNGPFALILSNPDGDTGCFDITNAIVGSQLPPTSHGVRRGVRR
jgi:CSLREA domain-containing protein